MAHGMTVAVLLAAFVVGTTSGQKVPVSYKRENRHLLLPSCISSPFSSEAELRMVPHSRDSFSFRG